MHAILITFASPVGLEDLREPDGTPLRLDAYVTNLRGRSGSIAKTWLRDGTTYGGFYLFAERAAAERYLAEVAAPLGNANPSMTDIRVLHFDVNEAMSERTLGLPLARVET